MDVRLPDGTVIKDVPEGTTKADLVAKLQKNGMTVPAEWTAAPKAGPEGKPMDRGEKVGFGMMDPIHGGAQLLEKVLPQGFLDAGNRANNWIADKTGLLAKVPEGGVDQMVKEREAQYQANRAAGGESGFDGYRTIGNVASPANLAIAAKLPAAATALGRVGAGSAGGALTSALNPVAEGEFATEKAKQVGLGAAFGGAVPALMGGISRIISPKASVNPDLALLKEAGVKPSIGQSLGGWANSAEEKLMSVPLIGDAIGSARRRALEQFNEAAINRAVAPVGGKVQGVGQEAVAKAGDTVSQAYDDVLAGLKTVKFDKQFAGEMQQLKTLAQSLTPEMRKKFNSTLTNTVGMRTSKAGGMTADTFKKVEGDVGKLASSYRGSSTASERELGDALTQLQALMRDQVARTSPAASKAMREADEGWANLVRVEGAAKAAANSDGVFTPGQLNTAIRVADKSTRKRAVARGEALMQDLGSAGQNVLGNKVPDSGTAGKLLLPGSAIAGLGIYEPTMALAAGGGALTSALLYTPAGQNALRTLVSSRPELAGPIAEALRKSSPALVPAGTQVGLELLK
jgi:hypothetical protein